MKTRAVLFMVAALVAASGVRAAATTAPTVQGCINPAPAAPGQATVFITSCKTTAFLPTTTTSVVASVSKTTPNWSHTFSGYKPTDLVVACPAGATVSGASCQVNGAEASALVAQSAVASFTVGPATPSSIVTVTWTAPTANTDGSSLTDLASYNVYMGASAAGLNLVGNVVAPTAVFKTNPLTVGNYFFTVTAVNSSGVESAMTSPVPVAITAPKTTPGAPAGVKATVN